MNKIRLNFLPFKDQDLKISVYRKKHLVLEYNDDSFYYDMEEGDGRFKYEVKFEKEDGFEEYHLKPFHDSYLISKKIYTKLVKGLDPSTLFIKGKENMRNRRIYVAIGKHPKGKKCIWIEPYFLKSKQVWGLLIDYSFVVNTTEDYETKFKLDRDILIAAGTLNNKGLSNVDFYLFKHNYLQLFIRDFLPQISEAIGYGLSQVLFEIESHQLNTKTYVFGNKATNSSSFLGLSKNLPLEGPRGNASYYFLYKKDDREIAVALLKGLRGDTFPTTFSGMEKLFRVPFSNTVIKGAAIEAFTIKTIDEEIEKIQAIGENVIPIIITNSKTEEEDDQLYYLLKHKFTNAHIPCQVVTKELVKNEFSLKYSLSNIGLQIFAKSGGKPWKMKPATNEYLIIGIGQSYHIEKNDIGNLIEKNLTYSVLTDSSGLFKDIKVIGEGVSSEESYYEQLVANIANLIKAAGYKKISIHVPFRMSKEKILHKVVKRIDTDIELSVLVINSKNAYFGFDYDNNALVPFESTYIRLSKDEFLVWFEGLQYNNPKINKRFGNPISIKFWYTNKEELFKDNSYKESLLQDCINLSGANWRGFKAKQLPVSVFYCQRIAEFISKFQQYNLEHIEIDNLKPWFL
jgi:hypothetical protein